MNFIFFSVHFPDFMKEFSHRLHQLGVNVLGIGDADYQMLDDQLKDSLTEYYRVENLGSYDEILRAVGYFTHRYGKIDRFESLNEHWLELEARIRTDFNIEGIKGEEVLDIRKKSRMKPFFLKSGVQSIPYIDNLSISRVKEFAKTHGFPVIVKPDKGAGAAMTFRLSGEEEIDRFFEIVPQELDFIAEKFIDGVIVTYDGLVDIHGNILFESSTEYGNSVMDVVNYDLHVNYINLKQVPDDVREAGRSIITGFGVRERFFHVELFRTATDGKIIALEVNMRPPGAWITDAMNFTHDMDVYREWANMVARGKAGGPFSGKYFTAYASRKSHIPYKYDHTEVVELLNGNLVKHSPIEFIFSRAMGNYAYQFRSESLDETRNLISLIHEEAEK